MGGRGSGGKRTSRLQWAPVNTYPRKIFEEEPEQLRAGALRIIAEEGWRTGSPATSGHCGLIANCNDCVSDCTKKWRFALLNRQQIRVQTCGAHGLPETSSRPPVVVKRQQRRLAKQYSDHTPQKAIQVMEADGVLAQLPNRRAASTSSCAKDTQLGGPKLWKGMGWRPGTMKWMKRSGKDLEERSNKYGRQTCNGIEGVVCISESGSDACRFPHGCHSDP